MIQERQIKEEVSFLKFGFKPGISFLYIAYCVWMCFQHEMLLLVVYKELFHQLW